MDTLVQDEISRVHAKEVYSDFECFIIGDIVGWSMGRFVGQKMSQQELIEAYWKDKLETC